METLNGKTGWRWALSEERARWRYYTSRSGLLVSLCLCVDGKRRRDCFDAKSHGSHWLCPLFPANHIPLSQCFNAWGVKIYLIVAGTIDWSHKILRLRRDTSMNWCFCHRKRDLFYDWYLSNVSSDYIVVTLWNIIGVYWPLSSPPFLPPCPEPIQYVMSRYTRFKIGDVFETIVVLVVCNITYMNRGLQDSLFQQRDAIYVWY